jgi:bifunctional UDP-N-acetylglucosamine pyrophosphorylase/glucosamine-1-phosphate N-acetyltransferase
MHLAYLGDCTMGEKVNIGAGTITCNYDGFAKHKTTIEDEVFIGSHTTIIPPIRIKRGSYTGAGSVITEDVPEDSLALGRSRQTNKEGWSKKMREQRKKNHETK